MGLPDLSALNQSPGAPFGANGLSDPYGSLGYGHQPNGNSMNQQAPI